ncbi:MAG: DUF362 domain-containing protein [Candidatus Bathyarchaeota archaeon]|nr:DUF362 domain-containing protein [Candidatus Bathyarchaeota archaeon]
MPSSLQQFGSVTVSRVRTSSDLRQLLKDQWLKTDVFIVKPNWFSPHPANFTDVETLRVLLEALDGQITITEAYSMERQDGSMKFTVDGEEVNWRWIMNHPNWDWIKKKGRWDEIRKQDKWFLDEFGFTDLFGEYRVDYVNVTEEVLQGRTADVGKIKKTVETRFTPVLKEQLYKYIPQRLYELRGATFISLGKVKGIRGMFPSLTMKNLFGLIPDPLRSWWHGPNDEWLGRSIVDINKIYVALFRVYGICEALRYATVSDSQGEVKVPWGSYGIAKDLGVLTFGRNLVALDAVLCGLIGVDPEKVSYIELGEEAFGFYNRQHVEKAKASKDWFHI